MKKNKRAVFLSILLICLVCIFTGCPTSRLITLEDNVDDPSAVDIAIGEVSIKATFHPADNEPIYYKWKTYVNGVSKYIDKQCFKVTEEGVNRTVTLGFEVLKAGNTRKGEFILYEDSACKTAKSGENAVFETDVYTLVDGQNKSYIGVNEITAKLGTDWEYKNKSGSSKIACSSYGIDDIEANVPLCIALSQTGAESYDCADFLRNVYLKATGTKPSSIYSRGKFIKEYTSTTAQVPTGLKDGDLIAFYNGPDSDDWAHIGMVFYDDSKGGWYVVHGNWGDEVAITSLQDTLEGVHKWTRYVYRSQ